jgi:oligopeptide transport system substrate-binding protein
MFLFLLFLLGTAHADETIFRVRLVEDPGSLDWNWGETQGEIVYQLMEGLFKTDLKGQPIAGVAKEWEWNKKKTEFKITLRDDAKWSDGKPVCAGDFVRSWLRLQDKNFASPYAHYATPLLRSYRAKGCNKLSIFTQRYAPELPALLAHFVFFPLRAEHLNKKSEAFKTGKGLLVNGPFQVKDWTRDQRLTLARNQNFVGSVPTIDGVEFLFIGEDSTALTLFELNKIDWLRDVPPPLRLEKFKSSGELVVYPTLIAFYFGLNSSKSKLIEQADVRQGLSLALARDELPKVLGQEIQPATRWLPAQMADRLVALPVVKSDAVAKAAVILKAAEKAGQMDLKLRVYSKPIHKQLAEWAQGQWLKKLGVTIPIELQEEKVYWSEIGVNPAPIFLSGVTAPYNHPRAFLQEFFANSSANWLGWKSDIYDLAVSDEKFLRAEDILLEAGHVIPLYTRGTVALVKQAWQGFNINPLGVVYFQNLQKK